MSLVSTVLPAGTQYGTKNPSQRLFSALAPNRLPARSGGHRVAPERGAHLWGMVDTTAPSLPVILTQDDVATLLKVPPRTLEDWRLTRSGPPYRKIGRHVRYELTEVMDWFRGQGHHA
jgi:hypothetical protein